MNPPQPAPYPLRMPPELRIRLSARAQANGRSLNAEILALLQHALDGGASPDLNMFAERVAEKVARKLKGK
jgi:plasmid stability protein